MMCVCVIYKYVIYQITWQCGILKPDADTGRHITIPTLSYTGCMWLINFIILI